MTEAFLKILELIAAWWHALRFWEILDVEEAGFIRRFGKPARDLKPGFNWKLPIVESACCENAQEGVSMLDPQSFRTTDGVDVVLRVSVTFKISNPRKYYLNAWGALNNIKDLVAGEVGEAVCQSDAEAVRSGKSLKLAEKKARAYAKAWGITIIRLRSADNARGRSLRLWQTQTQTGGQS